MHENETTGNLTQNLEKCRSSQDTMGKNSLIDRIQSNKSSDRHIDFVSTVFPNLKKSIDVKPNLNFRKKERSNE